MRKSKAQQYFYRCDINYTVPFFDNDPMGVVWHGNYVKYFEIAREALLDKYGYDYKKMKEDNVLYPIINVECKYRKSIEFSEEIVITAYITDMDGKLVINYEIFSKEGELKAFGKTEQVCLHIETKEVSFYHSNNFYKAFDANKLLVNS